MDAILEALNEFRKGTQFPAYLPYLRAVFFVALFGLPAIVSALLASDVLVDIRAALRMAGIPEKATWNISAGKISEKLNGVRPLTVQALADLPAEFWRCFAVVTAQRHGVPHFVQVGAALQQQAHVAPRSHQQEGAS